MFGITHRKPNLDPTQGLGFPGVLVEPGHQHADTARHYPRQRHEAAVELDQCLALTLGPNVHRKSEVVAVAGDKRVGLVVWGDVPACTGKTRNFSPALVLSCDYQCAQTVA